MTEETQMFLAKALYDNIAESPDELAFRRGDVLTVMEQNTSGLDGWWLCSLRGRQGIAPGNRLKILSGMVDGLATGDAKGGKTGGDNQQHLDSELVAQSEWRRSLEKSPNKVVTPFKKGDIYLYKQPNQSMEDYDVPPSRYFPPSKECSPEPRGSDLYDTPSNRPANLGGSLYDTPPSSKRASCERTPPGSQRASLDSNSSRRFSGDNMYAHTPPSSKRSSGECGGGGGVAERHYETPPGSKRASLERILSDDNPTYDVPTSSKSLELPAESTYDSPSSRRLSRDSTGTGSRASLLSTASNESCLSGSSSQLTSSLRLSAASASLPDSARSSLDASLHDAYDLPPREARALKQLSMDSGLGLYDTPGHARARETSPQPSGGYHMAGSASHLPDLPHAADRLPQPDMKRSRSLEHALDELYDSPRSNAPKLSLKSSGLPSFGSSTAVNHDSSSVYDIPPQVTRDSVISARSDSSDESVRLSSCSVDSRNSGADYGTGTEGLYEELLLDLDSALELLVKLQQEVTRTSSRLLAFVSSTWRTRESLPKRVYDIKVACVELNKALGEFVDFAQGTLGNSARLSDKKLISRLVRHVTPLQQQKQSFSSALRSLEAMKWQVNLLVEPLEPAASDDLGAIINLAKDLVPDVKKLGSVIQGNSSLLFKRSSDLAAHRIMANAANAADLHVASKPPIGPKPEGPSKQIAFSGNGVGGCGGGGGGGSITFKARTLQQRPLPAPPTSERSLPPPPHHHQQQQQQQKSQDLDLVGALDNLSDIANKGQQSRVADSSVDDRDYTDLVQEYDYVQLEARDVVAQQQSRDLQQQKQKVSEQTQPNASQIMTPVETKKILLDDNCHTQSPKDGQKTSAPQPSQKMSDGTGVGMLGDVGKLGDVDLVPTKESALMDTRAGSRNAESGGIDLPDGGADEQDLKTPVNLNGFLLPPSTGPQPPRYASGEGGADFGHTVLDPSDKQVLVYYSGQLETHSTLLTNAIDAFFTCIENNEPPKVFISNSKFVIVTAHKLVYISDSLHRSLVNGEVRDKVMHCANHMCECLKISVQATKVAALQYPSVPAVQEMVDRVVDVSHAAHELKLVITQASAL